MASRAESGKLYHLFTVIGAFSPRRVLCPAQ